MELLIINGSNITYCQYLASKLRACGYKHVDPEMYLLDDNGNPVRGAKRLIEAKIWSKSRALELVLKNQPVVISANNFAEADLRSFKVMNCAVQLIDADRLTTRDLLNLIEQKKQVSKQWKSHRQSRLSKMFFPFLKLQS
jgi:hypothetical protein